MSFIVSARLRAGSGRTSADRHVSHEHASMLSALDHGLALSSGGCTDVRIVDGNGRVLTPAALYEALFGPSGPVRETVALAA